MDTRTKEAVRYLGYGTHAVDDRTLVMIREAFEEIRESAGERFIYRIFELELQEPDKVWIDGFYIQSKDLYRSMKECTHAVLLAATLGAGTDRLLKRCTVTDMAKAVVVQACAAALLEEYVDGCQQVIEKKLAEEEQYVRPRFSPGYGDFSISYQEEILRRLDTSRQIGLSMTESSMLVPVKSVTAVMGICKTKEPCHKKGCEWCENIDCTYRRN